MPGTVFLLGGYTFDYGKANAQNYFLSNLLLFAPTYKDYKALLSQKSKDSTESHEKDQSSFPF